MALNAGLGYESKVRSVIRDAARKVPHLSVSSIGGKTRQDVADVTLIFDGSRIPVEVKLDGRAQMGSPLTVLFTNGTFQVKHDSTVDGATAELVEEELQKKQKDAERFWTSSAASPRTTTE